MNTIGVRAAQAIRERAKQNGKHVIETAEEVGVSKRVLWGWQTGNTDPRAYLLSEMAYAGYDIHWILTGEKK
jgi:transcriptional regulator with XRE-family HTH domain